jgi:AcrR family transcriptional regulator
MSTEPNPADRLSFSLKLLWERRERPARGPKPALTLEEVVDTAISVADADGLDALSMRRVARELGVGTMSLYRYVPGKAELLDLMLDRVSDPGEQIAAAEGKDWRGILAVVAHHGRNLYLAHPWLLQVNWSRPVLGPNTVAGLEFFVASLAGIGLTDQERINLLITIDGYVVGVTRGEIMYSWAVVETGLSDEEFWGRQYPVLGDAMASGRYPAMAGLSEDAFNRGWDESFEWGLQRVLDGIEALVRSRTAAGS